MVVARTAFGRLGALLDRDLAGADFLVVVAMRRFKSQTRTFGDHVFFLLARESGRSEQMAKRGDA